MEIGLGEDKDTGQIFLRVPITKENLKQLIRLIPFVINDDKLMDEINQLKNL